MSVLEKALIFVLALACVFTVAYLIGRIARSRRWSARGAQLCCLFGGVGVMAIVGAIAGSRPIFFMGTTAGMLSWYVCAKAGGYSLNQPHDEVAKPITLDLSKDAGLENTRGDS